MLEQQKQREKQKQIVLSNQPANGNDSYGEKNTTNTKIMDQLTSCYEHISFGWKMLWKWCFR